MIKTNKETTKDRISKLYFDTVCLDACKYCNGRDPNVDDVDAAIQTQQPLSYEKIN